MKYEKHALLIRHTKELSLVISRNLQKSFTILNNQRKK